MSVAARFWAKTVQRGDCIIWTAGTNQWGYGRFWDGKRTVCAHRWSFEQKHGPMDPTMFACHRCDTPSCVNPDHIFQGTAKENSRDAVNKGRLHGRRASRTRSDARISDDQVVALRERAANGERVVDLANEFSVSAGLISQIVLGISRPRLGGPTRPRPRSILGVASRRQAVNDNIGRALRAAAARR